MRNVEKRVPYVECRALRAVQRVKGNLGIPPNLPPPASQSQANGARAGSLSTSLLIEYHARSRAVNTRRSSTLHPSTFNLYP